MEVKPYAVYTSYYNLQTADLYSNGENDPIIDATRWADDHLAFDNKGNKLPFSVSCSIFALDVDRDKELLEDKLHKFKNVRKIAVHVIVFRTMDDKIIYDFNDKVLIDGAVGN